jgi:LPS sulfotransferase NodH
VIVNRRTFIVKRGCQQKIVELIREATPKFPHSHPRRLYTPSIAPFDVIAIETEFEDLAGYEKYWTAWGEWSGVAEFMEKWFELTEPGGTNEVWTLEEP